MSEAVKKTYKHGFLYKIAVTFLTVIIIVVLCIGGFLAYSALDGAEPAVCVPQGFYAYATVPSAGAFLQKTVSVQTLDSLPAGQHTAKLQGSLRSLRISPVLSAKWFNFASNFRTDAAFYSNGAYIICAKLGFRSAAVRLFSVVVKYNTSLLSSFLSMENLSRETENGFLYWIYDAGNGQKIYIGAYKDLLIGSSSHALFMQTIQTTKVSETPQNVQTVKRFIRETKKAGADTFGILTDINYFTESIGKSPAYCNIIADLNFPEYTAVNIDLNDSALSASGNVRWDTSSDGLKTILKTKSAVPGILSRLPKSIEYITLLKIGSPSFLFEHASSLFGKDILRSYENASKSCKLLFKKSIDELFFSWMGDEIGVFGTEHTDSPVFFVSVKNERRCRDAFNQILSSAFAQKDVSAVVDGLRIPRIEFPDIIKSLLHSFNTDLPTPFYVIQNGYVYLSQSAEALAALVNEVKSGNLLVKTENWKNITRAFSSETSVFAYYTVDRHVPSFLKNNRAMKSILKNYGKGVVSVKLSASQKINFEVYAQKTASHSLAEIAAFPYECAVKIQSRIYCAKSSANVPFAYWASGQSVYALNLADQSVHTLKLDDTAYVTVQTGKTDTVKAVWAVSARGTVYKTDYSLNPAQGFPVLTGERCTASPTIMQNTALIPVADKPLILFVESNAHTYYSDEMNAKLKNPPAVYETAAAAVPRSFDSSLYLFNIEGKIADGFPVALNSISAVQGVLYKDDKAELHCAVLTEDGTFSLFRCKPEDKDSTFTGAPVGTASTTAADTANADGKDGEAGQSDEQAVSDSVYDDLCEFSVALNAPCKSQPVYSANLKMFFAVTDRGDLYKIDRNCRIIDKTAVKQKNAGSYTLTLIDLDGNGTDELLVSGGGNAIYAYTSQFIPIDGFPVSGTGTPCFIDADGDGKKELISCGIDNTIHAYTGALK